MMMVMMMMMMMMRARVDDFELLKVNTINNNTYSSRRKKSSAVLLTYNKNNLQNTTHACTAIKKAHDTLTPLFFCDDVYHYSRRNSRRAFLLGVCRWRDFFDYRCCFEEEQIASFSFDAGFLLLVVVVVVIVGNNYDEKDEKYNQK